jgi:hypothetical protein
MKLNKKLGQGLSMNTIVIAAIVLVVLLIVLAIIYGTADKVLPFFDKQTECEGAREGTCTTAENCIGTKIYGLDCKDSKPVCCVNRDT